MHVSKPRILLVDDRPTVLYTFSLILQQHGHDVTGANSYSDAIRRLDETDFDLLLCDYSLGGDFSGIDIVDYAQMKQPGVRAILLTGYGAGEIASAAAERGIRVLYKPIEIRELLSAVAEPAVQRAVA